MDPFMIIKAVLHQLRALVTAELHKRMVIILNYGPDNVL